MLLPQQSMPVLRGGAAQPIIASAVILPSATLEYNCISNRLKVRRGNGNGIFLPDLRVDGLGTHYSCTFQGDASTWTTGNIDAYFPVTAD